MIGTNRHSLSSDIGDGAASSWINSRRSDISQIGVMTPIAVRALRSCDGVRGQGVIGS